MLALLLKQKHVQVVYLHHAKLVTTPDIVLGKYMLIVVDKCRSPSTYFLATLLAHLFQNVKTST